MFVRIEVARKPEFHDPRADEVLRRIELALPAVRRQIRWARSIQVFWLELDCPRAKLIPAISQIFWDPVTTWLFTGDLIPSAAGRSGGTQDLFDSAPYRSGGFFGMEKRFRHGVTDNVARTIKEAFDIVLGEKMNNARAASGELLIVEGDGIDEDTLGRVAREVFCNELIESWTLRTQAELRNIDRFHSEQVKWEFPRSPKQFGGFEDTDHVLRTFPLRNLDNDELLELSAGNLWALNLDEMQSIRKYFADAQVLKAREEKGLLDPTDVEMEMIAQTWSEHCKHKIFNAWIEYEEGESTGSSINIPKKVDGLFRSTISGTTAKLSRPWLLSVFSDNAGIVGFDEEDALCIKVETHNSPSALDPYGGALTGIVGVNRDILGCGRGARPIFNTDVFCVAPPDHSDHLPDRILHPRRILAGVRRGVEDGGNQSGIPTVNGALVFDERFLGKPLIYCGTGGIMPRVSAGEPAEKKEIHNGDLICMVGGRVGKDGIHGATFSSLALDETSPISAVQLGDPITQRRVTDFLLEARDRGLYRAVTDNGAGGLSSSVGELAQLTNGAKMDVGLALTKYPGLKPYELVVSESQERMTMAVPPSKKAEFLELAERRGVEVSVLGEFNDSGVFEILFHGKTVGILDLEFLHKGVPRMKLKAHWKGIPSAPTTLAADFAIDGPRWLKELLGRPNIASKEWLIRQYDHEVQGTSVIKPLHSYEGDEGVMSGPNDGAVIKPKPNSNRGVAVGCGINPKYSDIDAYLMAQIAVDEAVRNVIAVGAEYGREEDVMALVDNFCWPDPVRQPERAADLVRACYGLKDACLALGIPLISGKDSMKNDYRGTLDGKPHQISVPPTLLMTAMGCLKDVRQARTSSFKTAGDRIYLLGGQHLGLFGSELHTACVEQLLEKGGNRSQVVVPGTGRAGARIAAPEADWEMARRIYSWLGRARGEMQDGIRSIHDLSEGGLLVAIAECLIASGCGASVALPKDAVKSQGEDVWNTAFGEGFHSFVVTGSSKHANAIEEEWRELGIPFARLGEVKVQPRLEVSWGSAATESFSVPVSELAKAWNKTGYWE